MADRTRPHLDNYHLLDWLGEGGMGVVYLAQDIYATKEPPVAIKILRSLAMDDLPQFLNEARTIRLRHPNIAQVKDFGVAGDIPFIVMEYAPNGTLRQRHPKDTRVPLDAVVSYVEQVASALQYAHDRRLIHRDVKPGNMLIGTQNQILLSDFGIAVVVHSTLTQTPEKAIGTAPYMAPEQWRGEPLTATDQYALGITVYEWLCGNPPFEGNILQLQFQHTQVLPPPLREKVPTIPHEVEQVVLTALAKDPKQRFASAQAFAHALAAASAPTKTKEQWLAEGVAHHEAGRYEAALLAYDQALRLDAGDAAVYHQRGRAYGALQHYDQALDDYTRALQLAPEDVPLYFDRGMVYHALKHYDKAIADYDQVLRRDPEHSAAYRHRGHAYKELAIADYTQALNIEPNDAVSRQEREHLLHPRLLSRRAVMMGIGGAVGLAVVSGGLTRLLFPQTLTPNQTPTSTPAAWYDRNYLHKKAITIDHTKVSGGSNLSNFPVLISLPANSDLRTAAYGGYVQNSQGYDIIFTDGTQTTTSKLDHEIEKYVPTTGEIEMWVRLPTLAASTDTVIYIYFGNSRISSSQEKQKGVWDRNYQGVYHLSENAANTTVYDSTSHNNTGTNTANTSTKTAIGKIAGGLTYNGSSDYTNLGNPSSLQITGQIALEAWVNVTAFPGFNELASLIGKGLNGTYEGYYLRLYNAAGTNRLEIGSFTRSGQQADYRTTWNVSGWNTGSWHHIVGLYDGSMWLIYFDGVQRSSTPSPIGALNTTSNVYLGATFIWDTGVTRYFNGVLDEVRISNTGRSPDWIITEYHNQSSPSTFYAVSSLISR